MRRTSLLKFAFILTVLIAAVAPVSAQWATPTIDGVITPGEYGSNNELDNAGGTGQTWYMTWDANNLYIGIVNANLSEGAVIYVTGNPQESADLLHQRRRQSHRLQLRRHQFRVAALSREVRDLRQDGLPRVPQLRRRRWMDRRRFRLRHVCRQQR